MFRSRLPSRRDSIRRSSQQDYTIIDCALQHVHWQWPPTKDGDLHRPTMIDWLSRVDRQLPLSMLASEAGATKLAPAGTDVADMMVAPKGGHLLLRVGKVKMNWEERNYQLIVQFRDQVLASCPASKIAGLQDYFLLNLKDIKEIKASDRIEISICPMGNTMSEKIKVLKQAASGFLKMARANSKVQVTDDAQEEDPMVSIPLSELLKHEPCVLVGNYYVLAWERSSSTIVGEIAFQLTASPNLFVPNLAGSQKSLESSSSILHQQYLTIPSGKHHWKRVFALLHDQSIYLHDFQRHVVSHGAPINLRSMVDIKFVPRHANGLESVVRMSFEDEPELLVCADNEADGISWANAVSRAIWNQPYVE